MSSSAPPLSDGELLGILDSHALWLRSGGKTGACADFRGRDVRQADFGFHDLRQAIFAEADCLGACFRGSKLDHAILRGGRFASANFRLASLTGVDGRDASFYFADVAHTEWRGGDLTGADTSGWLLDWVHLESVDGILTTGAAELEANTGPRILPSFLRFATGNDLHLQDGGARYGTRVLCGHHRFLAKDTVAYCTTPELRSNPHLDPFPDWLGARLPWAVHRLLERACALHDGNPALWPDAPEVMAAVGRELLRAPAVARSPRRWWARRAVSTAPLM